MITPNNAIASAVKIGNASRRRVERTKSVDMNTAYAPRKEKDKQQRTPKSSLLPAELWCCNSHLLAAGAQQRLRVRRVVRAANFSGSPGLTLLMQAIF
jgi:hypothetical protein